MYMNSKNISIAILLLLLIGAFGFLFTQQSDTVVVVENEPTDMEEEVMPVEPDNGIGDGAEPIPQAEARGPESVIGTSVSGNEITAYHFGSGEKEVLFIGGIHGGYSWNTALVAYEMIDYLEANPSIIPDNVSVTIIPVANPDGLESAVGATGRFEASKASAISDVARTAGRFNANEVDLNRNFACEWSENATWQSRSVSGGKSPFSEPEAAAIQNYVNMYKPSAAVVWFSSEGKVYPSACAGVPSKASVELAATYATAAGYPAAAEFNAYEITGDMVNWMAKQNIPAISVLLTDHKNTEWNKNKAGIEAVLKAIAE